MSVETIDKENEIVDNVKFCLIKGAIDNICYSSQKIDMKEYTGKAILIVGCCEGGNYSAEMCLEYKNDERESAIISFSNCYFSHIERGKLKNVAVFSKFFSGNDVQKTMRALYD